MKKHINIILRIALIGIAIAIGLGFAFAQSVPVLREPAQRNYRGNIAERIVNLPLSTMQDSVSAKISYVAGGRLLPGVLQPTATNYGGAVLVKWLQTGGLPEVGFVEVRSNGQVVRTFPVYTSKIGTATPPPSDSDRLYLYLLSLLQNPANL